MNLPSFLRTPPPPHGFVADATRLAYGRLARTRRDLERAEAEPFGAPWQQLGPVGLLHVDTQRMTETTRRLVARLEKVPARASLVLPSAWLRSVVVDMGVLPRQRDEAEESIRWRLKKLLPCRPEDVRLDWVPAGENGKLLVLLGLDRPLTAIEEAFAAAGVQLVRLEPMVLALAALLPRTDEASVLVSAEQGAFGFALRTGGRLRWLRQKSLPAGGQVEVFLARELQRTFQQARAIAGADGELPLWMAAAGEELAERVRAVAAQDAGVRVRPLAGGGSRATLEGLALLGTASDGEAA